MPSLGVDRVRTTITRPQGIASYVGVLMSEVRNRLSIWDGRAMGDLLLLATPCPPYSRRSLLRRFMKIGGRMDASAPSMPERRKWLRWAIAVLVVVEAVHVMVATLVNDWDGLGTFLVVLVFALVSGLVIVGLTFGLLVRWGMKPHPQQRNRPAAGALAAGMLSVVSYAAFFVWAPLLVAPAAVLLGREGVFRRDRGRYGVAIVGLALGLASIAFGVYLIGYVLVDELVDGQGDYPFGF